MNTPNDEPKAVENSAYNPFPEPQTIPSRWDLSELLSTLPVETFEDEAEVEAAKGRQVNK